MADDAPPLRPDALGSPGSLRISPHDFVEYVLPGILPLALRSRILKPFLSGRFMKFAAVGASGVFVNLGSLAFLRWLGVHTNLASALAIELSILSNFTINHVWTFGDRREAGVSLFRHGARFHLVSLGGGTLQFLVFVAMNVAWLLLFGDSSAIAAYQAGANTWIGRWIWQPFVSPPDVGPLVYLSQMFGIGAATVWNYLLNFYWTWATRPPRAPSVAA
jgi:putative flippase GtrA